MRRLFSKRVKYLIPLVMSALGALAHAESEYDMYRAPPQPVQSMVLLDLSLKMGCAPNQLPPPEGEIGCGYIMEGLPPYQPDNEQQSRSRLSIVKQAFSAYAQELPGALGRVGLATYGNGGGVIRVPVSTNVHGQFLQTIETLTAGERPSLLGTLLEIGNYFSGQDVVFGRERAAYDDDHQADALLAEQYSGLLPRLRTQTVSHPEAVMDGERLLQREASCVDALADRGPAALLEPSCISEHYNEPAVSPLRYKAPSELSCSAQNDTTTVQTAREVLLLASQDGLQSTTLDQPVADVPLGVWINRFLSGNPLAQGYHPTCSSASEIDAAEACAIAMVEHLHTQHNLRISVVALGHDSDFLARLTAAGDGHYYSVDNAQDLQVALEAQLPPTAHTAMPAINPVISNMIPTSTAEGELSLLTTQFQSVSTSPWLGNIKRYGMHAESGQLNVSSSEEAAASIFQTCGGSHQPCISSTARSAWTQTARPDGKVVTRGGAADTLPPLSQRSLWVQLGNTHVPLQPATSVAALSMDQRQVLARIARAYGWQGNSLLTDAGHPLVLRALARYNQFAGVDQDNAEHERLRLLGLESWQHRSGESHSLGASVFGSPLLITYQSTPAARLKVLWWSGTDGFLRAINADTGEWLTSILPEAAISSLIAAERNPAGEVVAGLDTPWVALQHDHNRDGVIRRADGDYVYLYGGLRRAGPHILALDVTEPEGPRLLFDLSAGTPGFEALADAWSTPILTRLRLPGNSEPQTVLAFGGGYDRRFDGAHAHAACLASITPCGAMVYFVQPSGAEAGRLLWSIGGGAASMRHTQVSSMTSPITAPLKAVDLHGDGITDYLYALDIDGKVFRIGRPAPSPVNDALQVDHIASLMMAAPDRDNAFFFPPSIALRETADRRREVVLAIGSGRLLQPHSSLQQGTLYVLTDTLAQADMTLPLSVDSPLAVTLSAVTPEAAVGKRLWILPTHDTGEKLMSTPIIIDHQAFFLTYLPPQVDDASCGTAAGSQRLWAVDTRTARPLLDNAGQINPATPGSYAGTLQSPWVARLSPLLIDDEMYLLQGGGATRLGAYSSQPERVRWQQVLVGPQVQRR